MRDGIVVITGKTWKGLFKKYCIYRGHLYDSPGVSGNSTNKTLKKEYHRGDRVPVRYTMLPNNERGEERFSFEILEAQEAAQPRK